MSANFEGNIAGDSSGALGITNNGGSISIGQSNFTNNLCKKGQGGGVYINYSNGFIGFNQTRF